MEISDQEQSVDKAKWQKPVLIELDLDLNNVENGFFTGSDGAGGFNTSES